MNLTSLRFLKNLRDAPAEGFPCSRLPRTCQNLLTRLQTCGAVQIVPGQQGKRLRIANAEAFANVVRTSSPNGLDALDSSPLSRTEAVAQFGDAKAVRAGNVQGIFVRTSQPNIVLRRDGMIGAVDVTALTSSAGGAGLLLNDEMHWEFSGTVATIENEEVFWNHELILPNIDLAIYACGKMSHRLVRWLASGAMANCQIMHCGDYDPIGLLEYCRLRRACPGRVRLFVPDQIDALMAKYGKRYLLQADKHAQALNSLRKDDDKTVAKFVKLFDHLGKGLEQEILIARAKSAI